MTDNFKRPKPTVDYEALPLALEDIIYSRSDKDESIKEQQTRRRRIESKHIIIFKVWALCRWMDKPIGKEKKKKMSAEMELMMCVHLCD